MNEAGNPDKHLFPEDSPVFPFLNTIMASIHDIAPEKVSELIPIVQHHNVHFVMDQNTDGLFRARPTNVGCDVCCSVFGAEIVWAAAYSYVVSHRQLKEFGGNEIKFAENPRTAALPGLLEFGFDRRYGRRLTEPWPSYLPAPRVNRQNGTGDDVTLATRLWLCALAWILHHELAHVRLGHLDKPDSEINDEVEADAAATEWLIGGVLDPTVRLIRSLGIAIALVAIAGFGLHRNQRSVGKRTYPPAGERILRAFSHSAFDSDHRAQEFACVALKIHLDRFQIPTSTGPFENASDCLFAYCRAHMDWELGRTTEETA